VDAVDGADGDAGGVADRDAGLGDDVGHGLSFRRRGAAVGRSSQRTCRRDFGRDSRRPPFVDDAWPVRNDISVQKGPSADALALVKDVAAAVEAGHTLVTLTAACAKALARHLSATRLEIGVFDGDRATTVAATPDGDVQRGTRRRRGLVAPDALEAGVRVVSLRRVPAQLTNEPEVRRAQRSRAAALAVCPLRHDGVQLGYVLLTASTDRVSPESVEAAAHMIASGVGTVRSLARVAALSRRAHVEARELRSAVHRAALPPEVVAASAAMRRLFHEVIPLVARRDTTVLVRGETGTGKEVVARRIHALSPRANRPFLQVNCGAIPEALVESTLFGHERGAFTGANTVHRGVFERAHGGTLLLDEIGDLPSGAQVKLLRVLEHGVIERVGGEATFAVDVRVVAATHRPLEDLVRRGAFRADLLYRLDVFPIHVPPLRDRREDLLPLAHSIVARLAERFGGRAPRLSRKAAAALCAYEFPGNVRELENLLERAMVVATGTELDVELDSRPSTTRIAAAVLTYRAAEERCIRAALEAAGGRVYGTGGAAELLQLRPTTLQSKMQKLGIRRTETGAGPR
jgi:formate hydrogenlyase transcriptional activator